MASVTKPLERPPEQVCYTVKQFAVRWGISTKSVYRELNEGRLASMKIGKNRLIPIEAERAWMHSCGYQAADE